MAGAVLRCGMLWSSLGRFNVGRMQDGRAIVGPWRLVSGSVGPIWHKGFFLSGVRLMGAVKVSYASPPNPEAVPRGRGSLAPGAAAACAKPQWGCALAKVAKVAPVDLCPHAGSRLLARDLP